MGTYSKQVEEVYGFLETFSQANPGVGEGFVKMHESVAQDEALSAKYKELIALGIAIAVKCEGCIACHVKAALDIGATKNEIVETIGVAILMGGGPSVVYGGKAYDALSEFTA
ncbi:carboxymuconolactone decarboxylase family protein [Geofilum sp. OHC36d9]|uniref:carboxymuconolactone decarboxylase family protein n=1 Tax=Geofilum sp. OHC36d9 TaxID=3458413 RepID=UPI004033850D